MEVIIAFMEPPNYKNPAQENKTNQATNNHRNLQSIKYINVDPMRGSTKHGTKRRYTVN